MSQINVKDELFAVLRYTFTTFRLIIKEVHYNPIDFKDEKF